jgi:hypothetical protein
MRWERESTANANAHKARLLAELSEMKQAAWLAWDESRQPSEKVTVETHEGDGMPRRTRRQLTSRTGDPRYLSIVLNAIDAERRISGLDEDGSSRQVEVNSLLIDLQDLSPEAVGILCNEVMSLDRRLGIASPSDAQAQIEAEFLARSDGSEADG